MRSIVSLFPLVTLVTGAAAIGSAACSSSDAPAPWSCREASVPMGSAVECTRTTSDALTYDGVTTDTTGDASAATGTFDGTNGLTTFQPYDGPPDRVWTCSGGTISADCPEPTPVVADTGTADGAATGATATTTTPATTSECFYVPDLAYCPPGSCDTTGTGDATTGSDADAGATVGSGADAGSCKGNGSCGNNGNNGNGGNGNKHANGNASADGGSSDVTGGGTTGHRAGNGGAYTCEDHHGHVTCTQTPTCAAGTHPTPCGACAPNDVPDTCDCQPPSGGGCWVTGGGFIVAPSTTPPQTAPDGHENFGGNAKPMKDGRFQGEWNHVDHGTGNHAHSTDIAYLVCRHVDEPGPGNPGGKNKGFDVNQVYFGGHARWRDAATAAWADGYWFDVFAEDHGEPGRTDYYRFTLRKMSDPAAQQSGTVIYDLEDTLAGGNIQIHPPNNGHPYTPAQLPPWVSFQN